MKGTIISTHSASSPWRNFSVPSDGSAKPMSVLTK